MAGTLKYPPAALDRNRNNISSHTNARTHEQHLSNPSCEPTAQRTTIGSSTPGKLPLFNVKMCHGAMYLQHEQACLILEERFRESGEGVVPQGPFGGGVERAAQAERTRHVTSPTPRCTWCLFAAAHICYGVMAAAGDDPSNILTRAWRRQRLLFIRYPQPKQLIGRTTYKQQPNAL